MGREAGSTEKLMRPPAVVREGRRDAAVTWLSPPCVLAECALARERLG